MSRIKINESKIGRYGRMRLAFIREHRKDFYTELLFSGGLEQYLCELNEEAQERVWIYTKQIAESQGVNETLKAQNQMLWVGMMNEAKAQAEELVAAEMIEA